MLLNRILDPSEHVVFGHGYVILCFNFLGSVSLGNDAHEGEKAVCN